MKRSSLGQLTVNQLVERFAEIGVEQDQALLYDEIAKYNRLFDQMWELVDEPKRREGDQRRALVALYNHPKAQVRLKAAIATLALEPDAARKVLQIISDRDEYPQAADARGVLSALDKGTYVPS